MMSAVSRLARQFALAALYLALAACGGGDGGGTTTTPPPAAPNATVDFSTTYQTIRGFGGSSAWISNFSAAEADKLFGTNGASIGLSILRLRIDPGGQANWGIELNNAQKANAYGAAIIATPWTPPASMKSNSSTIMGSLNPGSYAAYAAYLESFVTYLSANGVTLYAISMQNEPDANVTYESCAWTGAQMDSWVANNAGTLTTKLMMPESEGFNPAFSDPTLQDAAAVSKVSIIAGHIYGTTPKAYPAATNAGKELWMTEHYLTDTGLTGALALAREVHDSLTVAGYNAYLWWWIDNYAAGNYANGLIDSTGNITPNGYALGQFARFIRPGYVRVSATANPQTGVYVSAYKGGTHYVVVAINTGASAAPQAFTLQNAAAVTSVTPYVTSSGQSLAAQSSIAVSGGAFTTSLPAQSVTTFVY